MGGARSQGGEQLGATYLNCLFGAEPTGSYVELRWRLRNGRGMGREFVGVRDPRLPRLIDAKGRATDLYIGVAPRVRHAGGRDAVERVHVLWADCDTPEATTALRQFAPAPAMVLRSGSEGHVQAYWPLWPPVGPDEAERANRKLAPALGADARATDAARILRPPGTFNFKSTPPKPVEVERLEVEVYEVAQVVGELSDPKPKRSRPPAARTRDNGDVLHELGPAVYVERLSGQRVGRDGKIACPFPDHEDRVPSLHVYEGGWKCYGCPDEDGGDYSGRGGDIFTFGSHLWGLHVERDFPEIRRRLLEAFAQ